MSATTRMDEQAVSELRGFLKALQSLCGDRARFWADQVSADGTLKESLQRHFSTTSSFEEPANRFTYDHQQLIPFAEMLALLDDFSFSKISSQVGIRTAADLRNSLLWYFQQFEIVSERKLAPSNPIASRDSIRVFASKP